MKKNFAEMEDDILVSCIRDVIWKKQQKQVWITKNRDTVNDFNRKWFDLQSEIDLLGALAERISHGNG